MSHPKVCIQIPHYNNAPYIEDCVASCERLTYPQLDINFYDDSSTDHTEEIIAGYEGSKIRFHRNKERLGRVANYQHCFMSRPGADWYINLDSDDYYSSADWISEAMEIVSENQKDNIAHIQSNFLTTISTSKIKPIKRYTQGYFLISGIDYLELCIRHYGFSHLGSIFHIAHVERYGAYTDDCMHTDFFTAMRVAINGNVLVSDKQVGVWRKHDGNQSDTRYSEEEYLKNELAYYRFFEGCEDVIPFRKLKNIVKLFEHREAEKKISLGLKTNGIGYEFKKSIRESTFNLSILGLFIKHILQLKHDFIGIPASTLVHISSGILTKALSLIIVFVSIPIVIKQLGLVNYGWIGLYANIVSAIYILDFGFTNIVTKEIAQSEKKSWELKQKLSTLESIYFIIGFLILGSLYFSAPYISHYFFIENQFSLEDRISILRWISIAVFFQWPHSFYSGALYGFGRQVLANNCQLILTLVKYLGAIFILKYISIDIKLFFYWQITISILTILVFKFLIYREEFIWLPIRYFSKNYLSQIKKLAYGISLIGIFSFVYTDLTNIVLVRWLSFQNYSYYTILLTIVTAMITYCATIKNALFPSISQLVAKNQPDDEYKSYLSFLKIITYSLIPISLYIAAQSYILGLFWLGAEAMAEAIAPSLKWIVLGSLSNSLMILPLSFLIAKHRTRYLAIQAGFLALISIPILYYLVMKFNLNGAAMFWFIINFIPCILLHIYFNNLYNTELSYWKQLNAFSLPCIYSLVGLMIYFAINKCVILSFTSKLWLLSFCFVLTYLGLLLASRSANYKDATNMTVK
jgi:O-antigen/teichoic acid export membrane protein/glycosyltransferase involved in cell wall biosynthesis